jgi:hypothetical protein
MPPNSEVQSQDPDRDSRVALTQRS